MSTRPGGLAAVAGHPSSRASARPRATRSPSVRLTRRGRVVVLLAALVVLLVGFSVGRATLAAGPSLDAHRVVVVQPGETVWGIADRLRPDEDPRVLVHRIVELNGLGRTPVTAGQRLRVPLD